MNLLYTRGAPITIKRRTGLIKTSKKNQDIQEKFIGFPIQIWCKDATEYTRSPWCMASTQYKKDLDPWNQWLAGVKTLTQIPRLSIQNKAVSHSWGHTQDNEPKLHRYFRWEIKVGHITLHRSQQNYHISKVHEQSAATDLITRRSTL